MDPSEMFCLVLATNCFSKLMQCVTNSALGNQTTNMLLIKGGGGERGSTAYMLVVFECHMTRKSAVLYLGILSLRPTFGVEMTIWKSGFALVT